MKCVNGKIHDTSPEELVRRRHSHYGDFSGTRTFLEISFVGSFERYNTRPYHNYETWGFGWLVADNTGLADSECLQCALEELFSKVTNAERRHS